MFTKKTSLASTSKSYVEVRGRIDGGVLTVEGDAPNGNKGIAVNVEVPTALANWFADLDYTDGVVGKPHFVKMQATTIGYPTVHVQVKNKEALNRNYGAAFSVDSDLLRAWVEKYVLVAEAPVKLVSKYACGTQGKATL